MRVSVSLNARAYGDVVHAPDLDAEHPLGRDDLQPGARAGDASRAADSAECVPLSSKSSTSPRGVDVAAEHVPARDDELVAVLQLGQLRQPARGDDHDVGLEGEDVVDRRRACRSARRRPAAPARTPATRRSPSGRGGAGCGRPGGSARRPTASPPARRRVATLPAPRGRPPARPARRRPPRSAGTRSPAGCRGASSPRGRWPRCGCRAPRPRRRCGRGSRSRRRRAGSRSRRPARTLRTRCGSARWARVIPTRSTRPSRMAWRAVATSSTFAGVQDGEAGRRPRPGRRSRGAARTACRGSG